MTIEAKGETPADLPAVAEEEVVLYNIQRLSAGAKKVLDELSNPDRMAIRKAPSLKYSEAMTRQWKANPQTRDLAMIFAGMMRAGEAEVTLLNYAETIRARYPVLELRYIKGIKDAARSILDSEKYRAVKGDAANVINTDPFKAQCNYAAQALFRDNRYTPTLFQRNGEWVEIQRTETGASIAALNRDTFAARLNDSTEWRKSAGETFRFVDAPKSVINQLFALIEKPVPLLEAVVTAPVFTPDGDLVHTPGYHKSGYYYAPPEDLMVPKLPKSVSEDDLAKARETLVDILCDFEMDGVSRRALEAAVLRGEGEVPASFLSAVGWMLEQSVRPMIDGPTMPLLISKTAPRAGGGLLVQIMQTVIQGEPNVRPLSMNEDERRKSLMSVARSCPPSIAYDNLPTDRKIDSPSLAMAWTEGRVTDRELQFSRDITVRLLSSTVMVGNRPPFSDEIIERLSLIELIPQTSTPAKRTGWKHPNLIQYVREKRGEILWALLVLVRNWIDKGKPAPKHAPVIGRFETYTYTIGGILEAAAPHWTTWLANRDKLKDIAGDEEEGSWGDLIDLWARQLGTGPDKTADTNDLADLAKTFAISLPVKRVHGGEEFDYSIKSLGRSFRGLQGRVFDVEGLGSFTVRKCEKRNKNGHPWYLSFVAPEGAIAASAATPERQRRAERKEASQSAASAATNVVEMKVTRPRSRRAQLEAKRANGTA